MKLRGRCGLVGSKEGGWNTNLLVWGSEIVPEIGISFENQPELHDLEVFFSYLKCGATIVLEH